MTKSRVPSPRPAPSASICALAAGLAIASLSPGVARAYEDQLGLSVTAGYVGITADTPYPPHALAVGVGVGVGLDDTWELRAHLDYAYHVEGMHRAIASVDLVYLVDVLSVVPYLGLSAGGALSVLEDPLLASPLVGDDRVRGDLRLGIVLGLDVLLSREAAIGLELRPGAYVTDFDRSPIELGASIRLTWLLET